jgi:hypothetical protein
VVGPLNRSIFAFCAKQDLSNTVWTCATLLEISPALLAAISHQSVQKLPLFLKLVILLVFHRVFGDIL